MRGLEKTTVRLANAATLRVSERLGSDAFTVHTLRVDLMTFPK
jgi:hypothetical protein